MKRQTIFSQSDFQMPMPVVRSWPLFYSVWLFALLIAFPASSASPSTADARVFLARGVVEVVQAPAITIKHEAITNYMAAMTMPFHVKDPGELTGLQRGDQVNFKLHVTENESWVSGISKVGKVALPPLPAEASISQPPDEKFELLHYKFTNELGQAVSLSDFPEQALAITFFYTRCPLPDFCPRLSKNFAEASHKLAAMTNAPTNWHFLSISFDPEFDSPEILKSYGQLYQSDPARWNFLTGPRTKIRELAQRAGVTLASSDGTINHNFRTLIIDASGQLQTVFPITGDFSDLIVAEMLKAAAVTNVVSGK
ncbi:MAG TPA: SCO family protein [Verrucomicrobiae bacterium]|jgi:protein SCO1/2